MTHPGSGSALCRKRHHGTPLAVVAEFVGTATFLFSAVTAIRFTAPGAALAGVDTAVPHGRVLVIGLAVGGSIGLFSLTPLARCSGAHLNPAVTLMLRLRREMRTAELASYVAAQVAGGFAGVALARWVWGDAVAGPAVRDGLIQPGPGWTTLATGAGELVMTAALLLVLLAMRSEPRLKPWGPLPAAATITSMIWLGGSWSGGSFNPVRSLAPAVWAGDGSYLAVYLAVPLLAAALTAGPVLAQARRGRSSAGQLRSRGGSVARSR